MLRVLLSMFIILLATACGPRHASFYPCHDDGTIKPRVVLLPISDVSGQCEMAQELMQDMRYQLMDRGNVYVYPEESVCRQVEKMGNIPLFGLDISYAHQFGGADFVVATELVECRRDFYGNVEDKCMPPHLQRKKLLIVSLRVRIIDLRCNEPRIVLQEIMTRNLLIPDRKANEIEVDLSCFREVSHRLVFEFVQRLEDVTWSLR